MLAGNAVFFMDGYDKAMKISSRGYPGLDVSEAETEKVLRGSKEGFCDRVKINAGSHTKAASGYQAESGTAGYRCAFPYSSPVIICG